MICFLLQNYIFLIASYFHFPLLKCCTMKHQWAITSKKFWFSGKISNLKSPFVMQDKTGEITMYYVWHALDLEQEWDRCKWDKWCNFLSQQSWWNKTGHWITLILLSVQSTWMRSLSLTLEIAGESISCHVSCNECSLIVEWSKLILFDKNQTKIFPKLYTTLGILPRY